MNILQKIKCGDSDLPPRTLLAGPEGIGKSTFGSKAPDALFIAAEDGLTGLDHVKRLTPSNLDELHSVLDALMADPSGFKNIVVDTTDWLERLICKSICERDSKADIEAYGYGKGYVVLENELVRLLQKFDAIRQKHRIGIVLLAHVQIRTFNDPRGDSWDRYEMKGHKKFTGILREWPDACLFAVHEVFKTEAEKGSQRKKAIGGERIIHTQWSPAWDAKNRLSLPETLPLEWDAYAEACKANSTESLRRQLKDLFAAKKEKLSPEDSAKWAKGIASLDTMTADRLKTAIEKLSAL